MMYRYRYTVIRPDGTTECGTVNWPADPSVEAIGKLVRPIIGGGPIEHVRILDPAKAEAPMVSRADYRDMFVDEMGLVGDPPAARNATATILYRANWLRAHPEDDPEDLPYIAGTAVVFDRVVWR